MKKLNFKMAFMMAAVVIGSPVFTSCSNDDDNDSAGGGMTSKHISKMTWSDGDELEVTTYEYDSQGRVVKKTETVIEGRSEYSTTTTYTYGGNTIISKTQGDSNDGETHTYTLSNGRITKDVEKNNGRNSYTSNYTYDSNGYLILQAFGDDSDDSYSGKMEFTWTDGNLTKSSKVVDDIYSPYSYTYTVSYSNILWPQNLIAYWDGTNMDEVLEPLGAWGKMPKNLPTKFVEVNDNGETNGWTIDYTIENGEIVKMIVKDLDGSNTQIYTIEWK